MSHQTGIGASEDLKVVLASSKDADIRVVKVAIVNEELVLNNKLEIIGSWEDDWDKLVLGQLEEEQPCYILYRLDSKNSMGYEWVYISYSPDHSPVRQKMLYAATRATLKKEFGGGQIKEELFGTAPHEVSLRGYKKHVVSQNAPAPLSMAEEELQEIKKNETQVDISVDTKHQTMTGLSFPLSHDAIDKLKELGDGRITYVQLSLDLTRETVELESHDTIDATRIASRIPLDHARYHFFRYKHSHEGDYLESIVFIYSMPGYKCSVKERMLYSSCKSPLIDNVEQSLGIEVTKKIEVDDPKEVTEEFIYEEVHPKKTIVRPQFAKPKGPGGRGPRRVTRAQPPKE